MPISQSMKDKTVLITGATDGIGKVTALRLAEMGAKIIGVGRNLQKCATVAEEIASQSGNSQVAFLTADLSSQIEVRSLASEFKDRFDRLDVLINNAGAFFVNKQTSADDIEMTFALNHLSYFLLTNLLLDRLAASAPGRVVVVSSAAHLGSKLNFDDLQFSNRYNGWAAYGQSKLANILFAKELSRRFHTQGISVNALHPGFVATRFGHNNGSLYHLAMTLIQRIAAISPEEGARTSVYLASSQEALSVTGQYFVKSKPARASEAAQDEASANHLWNVSAQLVGMN